MNNITFKDEQGRYCISKERIKELWSEVFPNSNMYINNACLGSGLSCSGRLAKDKSECNNNIIENDPLTYHFLIENGNYEEYRAYIYIKPTNPYMVYSSQRLRKKNIKNITSDKLKARFEQVKALVVDNIDNFINIKFDIKSKV